MQENRNEPVIKLGFGICNIFVDSTEKFTLDLIGGEFIFDLDEINKLYSILIEFDDRNFSAKRTFQRTKSSKIVKVNLEAGLIELVFGKTIRLIEDETHTGFFDLKDLPVLRQCIWLLTSHASPIRREAIGESVDKKNTFEFSTFSYPVFGASNKKYSYDLFVLMPFTLSLKPVYDDYIKRVAKMQNLSVARADDFFSQNAIMHEVWSAITQASILIADCTGKNPNVFYEIGIAHTIGKPVILITQNQDDVPFDLRHIRYIQYEYTPSGMIKFENMLTTTILEIMKDTSTGK